MKNPAADSVIEFPVPATRQEGRTEASPAPAPTLLPQVVIGRLVALEDGQPRVDFPGNPEPGGIPAQTGVPLSPAFINREVVLAFVDGDSAKPVILSRLLDTEPERMPSAPVDLLIDGERLLITAQKEIVLRCGEASITLTAAGKVLIKGTYVLSRSAGYNKIKGAAVDIN